VQPKDAHGSVAAQRGRTYIFQALGHISFINYDINDQNPAFLQPN